MKWLAIVWFSFNAWAKIDSIYYNGNIITLAAQQEHANAMAISGHQIVKVGGNAEILKLKEKNTKLIDLRQDVVLPGLIDAHVHLLGLGLKEVALDLVDTQSPLQIAAMVKKESTRLQKGQWIKGRGWDQNDWSVKKFPHHHILTAISPNHPVLLKRIDGHAAWVNQLALQKAGITKETPDPPGGKIVRDKEGNATGVLIDQAMSLVNKVVTPYSREQKKRALKLGMKKALSMGLTSLHLAGVGREELSIYQELKKENQLAIRLYVMLLGSDQDLLDEHYKQGIQVGPWLTVRSVKLMADGALGSRGAALLAPYSDKPSHSGLLILSERQVFEATRKATQAGFQVGTHAIGDRANHIVLNAYERVLLAAKKKDHRLRVEHAQILSSKDIPRFGKLGVLASMQATHCTSDGPWVYERIGKKRAQEGAYVWRSLIKSGAKILNGTDAPVERLNPFETLYATITRKGKKGELENGFHPEQALSRMEALKSMTLWPAYGSFEEKVKGSIEAGKLADFIVVDKNVITVDLEEILKVKVKKTVLGGEVVYQNILKEVASN